MLNKQLPDYLYSILKIQFMQWIGIEKTIKVLDCLEQLSYHQTFPKNLLEQLNCIDCLIHLYIAYLIRDGFKGMYKYNLIDAINKHGENVPEQLVKKINIFEDIALQRYKLWSNKDFIAQDYFNSLKKYYLIEPSLLLSFCISSFLVHISISSKLVSNSLEILHGYFSNITFTPILGIQSHQFGFQLDTYNLILNSPLDNSRLIVYTDYELHANKELSYLIANECSQKKIKLIDNYAEVWNTVKDNTNLFIDDFSVLATPLPKKLLRDKSRGVVCFSEFSAFFKNTKNRSPNLSKKTCSDFLLEDSKNTNTKNSLCPNSKVLLLLRSYHYKGITNSYANLRDCEVYQLKAISKLIVSNPSVVFYLGNPNDYFQLAINSLSNLVDISQRNANNDISLFNNFDACISSPSGPAFFFIHNRIPLFRLSSKLLWPNIVLNSEDLYQFEDQKYIDKSYHCPRNHAFIDSTRIQKDFLNLYDKLQSFLSLALSNASTQSLDLNIANVKCDNL